MLPYINEEVLQSANAAKQLTKLAKEGQEAFATLRYRAQASYWGVQVAQKVARHYDKLVSGESTDTVFSVELTVCGIQKPTGRWRTIYPGEVQEYITALIADQKLPMLAENVREVEDPEPFLCDGDDPCHQGTLMQRFVLTFSLH